jgi:hypothetical protein
MKVINIKDLPDGGADIEIEFDSQKEHEFYWKIAKNMGLTLNEFFIKAVEESVKDMVNKDENTNMD